MKFFTKINNKQPNFGGKIQRTARVSIGYCWVKDHSHGTYSQGGRGFDGKRMFAHKGRGPCKIYVPNVKFINSQNITLPLPTKHNLLVFWQSTVAILFNVSFIL